MTMMMMVMMMMMVLVMMMMMMMMNHGLTSPQRNGVIIKLIIDGVNVSLAMVIPQHPHHKGRDRDTDECILLRKENNTKRFLCKVFQLSADVISVHTCT